MSGTRKSQRLKFFHWLAMVMRQSHEPVRLADLRDECLGRGLTSREFYRCYEFLIKSDFMEDLTPDRQSHKLVVRKKNDEFLTLYEQMKKEGILT
jgi:hypothetical protein